MHAFFTPFLVDYHVNPVCFDVVVPTSFPHLETLLVFVNVEDRELDHGLAGIGVRSGGYQIGHLVRQCFHLRFFCSKLCLVVVM